MAKKIDYRCPECGTRDVVSDACAKWDFKKQQWMVENLLDFMVCNECEHEHDSGKGFEIEVEAK